MCTSGRENWKTWKSEISGKSENLGNRKTWEIGKSGNRKIGKIGKLRVVGKIGKVGLVGTHHGGFGYISPGNPVGGHSTLESCQSKCYSKGGYTCNTATSVCEAVASGGDKLHACQDRRRRSQPPAWRRARRAAAGVPARAASAPICLEGVGYWERRCGTCKVGFPKNPEGAAVGRPPAGEVGYPLREVSEVSEVSEASENALASAPVSPESFLRTPVPPPPVRYHCQQNIFGSSCVEADSGHSTMEKCQEACNYHGRGSAEPGGELNPGVS
eukprot:gene12709-biopygen12910